MVVVVTYTDGSMETFVTESMKKEDVAFHLDGAFVEENAYSISIPWTAVRKVERVS